MWDVGTRKSEVPPRRVNFTRNISRCSSFTRYNKTMHPPSRARRILKWIAVGTCALIPAAWIASVFAGVRVVTPVGSIAIYYGILEIRQSPPMAELASQHASGESWLEECKETLLEAEAQVPANKEAEVTKAHLVSTWHELFEEAVNSQAAQAAYWGIPIATTPNQSMGVLRLKPFGGPRLSRSGLGIRLPTYHVRGKSASWTGVWIPLWVIALPVAVAWGIIRWRRRPIPHGHCSRCGYDLTGNTSGTCSECGERAAVAPEKSGR